MTPADLAEYEAVRQGLAAAAARRELAERHRADAMRETGALMRRAKVLAAREPSLRVDVTDASAVTGLSRPTLYSLMGQETAPGGSRDYAGMSDADLAAAHIAYGYDLTGPLAGEFAARFPEVESLRGAAVLLARAQGRGPLDGWPGEPAPGAQTLLDAYRERAGKIAEGTTLRR
jgi:hypothetical protein